MIGEYESILERLIVVVNRLGFELLRDEEFFAECSRNDGWAIWLEGDRVGYPAFTISVVRTEQSGTERSYSLWLLMRYFEPRLDPERRRPSLENQLWFLECFAVPLFNEEERYRVGYKELDEQQSL